VVLILLSGSVPALRAGEADPRIDEARAAVVEKIAFMFDAEWRPTLEKVAAETEKAQASAVKRIFDNKRYPTSAQAHRGWRVGIDVQPGHKEMERLVAAALIQHNSFLALLAPGLGVKTRLVGARAPTTAQPEIVRPVMSYGITVIDTGIAKFLKTYRTKHDIWVSRRGKKAKIGRGDYLLEAIAALARDDWGRAARAGRKLRKLEKTVWEAIRAACVLNWNERHKARHSSNEMDGVRVLNAYRVGLGLNPLVADKRLQYIARDFANEMVRGKFFSHQHPTDPSRRTIRRRANRAGYRGTAIGENVSSEGDAVKAMWRWRADAGHHRTLVQKFFRGVGMGCNRYAVLNPGSSTSRSIRTLYGTGR